MTTAQKLYRIAESHEADGRMLLREARYAEADRDLPLAEELHADSDYHLTQARAWRRLAAQAEGVFSLA